MAFKLAVLSFILLMVSCLSAFDLDTYYQEVKGKFDGIRSIQANFSQENKYSHASKTLLSSGVLYYQPGKLLLDYRKPNVQKLIILGNKVQVYDKASATLLITSLGSEPEQQNPLSFVYTYWEKSSRELMLADSNVVKVKLTPRKDKRISSITVSFDRHLTTIRDLVYTDTDGNRVSYRFSAQTLDNPIPKSVWSFTPPKGTNIVHQ